MQFAVAQWRSIWITIAAQPLSKALEAATGVASNAICAEHFEELVQALDQMPPSPQEGSLWLKEVRIYHGIVQACLTLSGTIFPPLSNWARRELAECARFAAVIFDQRLNANFTYDV